MATPAFVAAGTQVNTAANVATPTTLSPNAPAGREVGNLLVLVTNSRGIGASAATPSNWNTVTGFPVTSGTASGGKIYIFTRIADGTATDNASFAWSSLTTGTSGDSASARILAFRNTRETRDAIAGTPTDQAATTTFNIPAITTAVNGAIIIGLAMRVHDTAHTFTISTYTERFDGHTNSGTGHGTFVAEIVRGTAGTQAAQAVTPSNTTSMRVLATAVSFQSQNDPLFTQGAYRFEEDGTETGSTQLGTESTALSRDVTSNSNILLRVRLQETNDGPGIFSDDYKLQYRVNGGSWTDTGTGAVTNLASANLTDGGATTNRLAAGSNSFVAGEISETGTITDLLITRNNYTNLLYALTLNSASLANSDTVEFQVLRNNATTGITYSTVPTINVTKSAGAPALTQAAYNFYEDGSESASTAISATNSVPVGISVNSDRNVLLRARLQNTNANAGAGTDDYKLQYRVNAGAWTDTGTGAVTNFASGNLTDGNATTNRLGAGTNSFGAGEISEDGIVDDYAHPASNYTEHLYAITLVAASLANADSVEFRILKNNATTDMTYTSTPTIIAIKGGTDSTEISSSETITKPVYGFDLGATYLEEENFDGGTNGATVANTDGFLDAGGFVNAPAYFNYSNARSITGSLSVNVGTASTGACAKQLNFSDSNIGLVYTRFYFYLASGTISATFNIASVIDTANAAASQLKITTAGALTMRNTAGSADVGTATTLTRDQWYRVEWKVDDAADTQTLRLFTGSNLHGDTPDVETSGAYTSTLGFARTRIGMFASPVNGADMWFDSWATGLDDWIGPYTRGKLSATYTINKAFDSSDSTEITGTDSTVYAGANPTLAKYDFDSGSNGSPVLTSDTPTTGDTAFDGTLKPGDGVMDYDNTQSVTGGQSMKVTTPTSGSTAMYMAWTEDSINTNTGTMYLRGYARMTALPGTAINIASFGSGNNQVCGFVIAATGKPRLVYGASALTAFNGTTDLPTDGSWFRYELKIIPDATNGHLVAKVYTGSDLHTDTPTETFGDESTNFATGGTIDRARFGVMGGSSSLGWTYHNDEVAVSDFTWIGTAVTDSAILKTSDDTTELTGTDASTDFAKTTSDTTVVTGTDASTEFAKTTSDTTQITGTDASTSNNKTASDTTELTGTDAGVITRKEFSTTDTTEITGTDASTSNNKTTSDTTELTGTDAGTRTRLEFASSDSTLITGTDASTEFAKTTSDTTQVTGTDASTSNNKTTSDSTEISSSETASVEVISYVSRSDTTEITGTDAGQITYKALTSSDSTEIYISPWSFTDDFNRADGALGNGWIDWNGDSASIVNNEMSANGYGWAQRVPSSRRYHGSFYVRGNFTGLIFSHSLGYNNSDQVSIYVGGGELYITISTDGYLAAGASTGWVEDDLVEWEIDLDAHVKVWVNGTLRGTLSNSSYSTLPSFPYNMGTTSLVAAYGTLDDFFVALGLRDGSDLVYGEKVDFAKTTSDTTLLTGTDSGITTRREFTSSDSTEIYTDPWSFTDDFERADGAPGNGWFSYSYIQNGQLQYGDRFVSPATTWHGSFTIGPDATSTPDWNLQLLGFDPQTQSSILGVSRIRMNAFSYVGGTDLEILYDDGGYSTASIAKITSGDVCEWEVSSTSARIWVNGVLAITLSESVYDPPGSNQPDFPLAEALLWNGLAFYGDPIEDFTIAHGLRDGSNLVYGETTSGFITATASDTTQITSSETASVAIDFPGSDTTQISSTETTDIQISGTIVKSASDTTEITGTDNSTSNNKSTSDTTQLTGTDAGVITQKNFSTSDTTEITGTDNSTSNNKTTSDTTQLTGTDAGVITEKRFSTTDSTEIIGTDASTSNNKTTSDTTQITGTDAGQITQINFSTSDTTQITGTDNSTENNKTTSDTTEITGTDAGVITRKEFASSDTTQITGTDASTSNNKTASDTTEISSSETAVITEKRFSASDTTQITGTDNSTDLYKSTSDTTQITSTETTSGFITAIASDTTEITGTENVQSLDKNLPGTDSTQISSSETADVVVSGGTDKTASDTTEVAGTDSGAIYWIGINSTDTTQITGTDSITEFFKSSSDTSEVTGTDSGLVTQKNLSASDTTQITGTETVATEVRFTTTDTTQVTGTDTSTNNNKSTSDTTDISSSETTQTTRILSTSDTTQITGTESFVIGDLPFYVYDSTNISSTETTSGSITATASDTTQVTSSESADTVVSTTGSDTTQITSSETTQATVSFSASDSTQITSSESVSFATISAAGSDSTQISSTETSSYAINFPGSDSTEISSSETTDLVITGVILKDTSDSTEITSTEAFSITKSFASTDSTSISSSETTSGYVTGSMQDAGLINSSETVSFAQIDFSTTDTTQITGSETTSTNVSLSRSDSTQVDSSETSDAQITGTITKNASDTTDISSTETADKYNISITSSDTTEITTTETGVTQSSAVNGSDTTEISSSETTATSNIITVSDTTSITTSETVAFGLIDFSTADSTEFTTTDQAVVSLSAPPGSDTGEIFSTESSSIEIGGQIDKSASDNTEIASSESTEIVYSGQFDVSGSDATQIDSAESTETALQIARTDSTIIYSEDQVDEIIFGGLLEYSTSDTTEIGAAEETSKDIDAPAQDTWQISCTEDSTVHIVITSEDSTVILSPEGIGFGTVGFETTDETEISSEETQEYSLVYYSVDSGYITSEETSFVEELTYLIYSASETVSLIVSEEYVILQTRTGSDPTEITTTENTSLISENTGEISTHGTTSYGQLYTRSYSKSAGEFTTNSRTEGENDSR